MARPTPLTDHLSVLYRGTFFMNLLGGDYHGMFVRTVDEHGVEGEIVEIVNIPLWTQQHRNQEQ